VSRQRFKVDTSRIQVVCGNTESVSSMTRLLLEFIVAWKGSERSGPDLLLCHFPGTTKWNTNLLFQ